jgi:hypothetical protein
VALVLYQTGLKIAHQVESETARTFRIPCCVLSEAGAAKAPRRSVRPKLREASQSNEIELATTRRGTREGSAELSNVVEKSRSQTAQELKASRGCCSAATMAEGSCAPMPLFTCGAQPPASAAPLSKPQTSVVHEGEHMGARGRGDLRKRAELLHIEGGSTFNGCFNTPSGCLPVPIQKSHADQRCEGATEEAVTKGMSVGRCAVAVTEQFASVLKGVATGVTVAELDSPRVRSYSSEGEGREFLRGHSGPTGHAHMRKGHFQTSALTCGQMSAQDHAQVHNHGSKSRSGQGCELAGGFPVAGSSLRRCAGAVDWKIDRRGCASADECAHGNTPCIANVKRSRMPEDECPSGLRRDIAFGSVATGVLQDDDVRVPGVCDSSQACGGQSKVATWEKLLVATRGVAMPGVSGTAATEFARQYERSPGAEASGEIKDCNCGALIPESHPPSCTHRASQCAATLAQQWPASDRSFNDLRHQDIRIGPQHASFKSQGDETIVGFGDGSFVSPALTASEVTALPSPLQATVNELTGCPQSALDAAGSCQAHVEHAPVSRSGWKFQQESAGFSLKNLDLRLVCRNLLFCMRALNAYAWTREAHY